MAIAPEQMAALAGLLARLTPDHVSSIAGSLSVPDSLIGTAKDSTKHDFFVKLVELDLAVEMPLPEDIDPQVRETVTTFAIKEDAKPEIERLLSQS